MRQVISREVAITECWLDEQARATQPATIGETVRGMNWRHAAVIVVLALAVYGVLLFT